MFGLTRVEGWARDWVTLRSSTSTTSHAFIPFTSQCITGIITADHRTYKELIHSINSNSKPAQEALVNHKHWYLTVRGNKTKQCTLKPES